VPRNELMECWKCRQTFWGEMGSRKKSFSRSVKREWRKGNSAGVSLSKEGNREGRRILMKRKAEENQSYSDSIMGLNERPSRKARRDWRVPEEEFKRSGSIRNY